MDLWLDDMIVLRGRNIAPHHIEQAVEGAAPTLRRGRCASFSIEGHREARLVVVAEVSRPPDADWRQVLYLIRAQLLEHAQLSPHAVVLVEPDSLPSTSSGELQRHACRQAFLSGSLPEVAHSISAQDERARRT